MADNNKLQKPHTRILGKGEDISQFGDSGDMGGLNLKMFANYVKVGGEHQSIFEENAYTFIYISGNVLLDALAVVFSESTTLEIIDQHLDGQKMKLKNRSQIKILAPNNVSNLFSNQVILFTQNEPLNISKYLKGEQELFVAREIIPTAVNQKITNINIDPQLQEAIENLEQNHNMTSYDLVNIEEINNVNNSVIVPIRGIPIEKPTKIIVEYDKSWACAKIFGRGKIGDHYSNINFQFKNDGSTFLFAIIKLTPISIVNKLICKCETFDHNISLPYNYLKTWTGVTKHLRQVLISVAHKTASTKLYQVFLSILELTKAFSNSFNDYQIEGTDGRSGIDPKAVIGEKKIGLLSGIASRDANETISGRIIDWEMEYPREVNQDYYKLFKVFVNMLSPYMQCDLALGGGLTKTNQIANIWYFDLQTAITKGIATKDRDGEFSPIGVQLKSQFYDIDPTNNHLTLKEQFHQLSTYQTILLDEIVAFAELEEQIRPINLPARMGDKDPANEDISKYYFYVPVDNQSSLQNIYGETENVKITAPIEHAKTESQFIKLSNLDTFEYLESSRRTYPLPLKPDEIPKQNSTPPVIPSPLQIYEKYIRDNLASNRRMKFIAGVPAVSQIKVKYLRTEIDTYWVHPSSVGGGGITGGAGGVYDWWTFTFHDVYELEYHYVYITISGQSVALFTKLQTELDKNQYFNLVKKYFSPEVVKLSLEFNNDNPNEIVEEISQIVLSGLWGNTFKITIANKTGASFTSPLLKFISEHDETKTKTKINL